MKLWIISYDIVDSRVRNRVASVLKDHGKRVQYSVFECWLTGTQLKKLRDQIREIIGPEDQVRWYPLCSWCAARTTWQGLGEVPKDTGYFVV